MQRNGYGDKTEMRWNSRNNHSRPMKTTDRIQTLLQIDTTIIKLKRIR